MTPTLTSLLASVETQAQRLADGMSVNKEKLSREITQVTGIVRTLNEQLGRLNVEQKASPAPGSAFDSGIFKDIFGK